MKTLTIFSAIVLTAALNACNSSDCQEGDPNNNCACYEIYAPVCGCDGVTYSNDCHAECAGITDYREGECD